MATPRQWLSFAGLVCAAIALDAWDYARFLRRRAHRTAQPIGTDSSARKSDSDAAVQDFNHGGWV